MNTQTADPTGSGVLKSLKTLTIDDDKEDSPLGLGSELSRLLTYVELTEFGTGMLAMHNELHERPAISPLQPSNSTTDSILILADIETLIEAVQRTDRGEGVPVDDIPNPTSNVNGGGKAAETPSQEVKTLTSKWKGYIAEAKSWVEHTQEHMQDFVEHLDWNASDVLHDSVNDLKFSYRLLRCFDDNITITTNSIKKDVAALLHPCFTKPLLAVSGWSDTYDEPGLLKTGLWRSLGDFEQYQVRRTHRPQGFALRPTPTDSLLCHCTEAQECP